MKGSVYQREIKGVKQKTWTITYDLPIGPDGKRKQKQKGGFKTKKEAERELTAILNSINTGSFVEPSKMTLGDLLDQWISHQELSVKPYTMQSYESIVNTIKQSKISRVMIEKLTPMHFNEFFSEQIKEGKKSSTVVRYFKLLKSALDKAVKWGIIIANPAGRVDPPRKERTNITPMTAEEAQQILNASEGTFMYEIIYLALQTGLRRGELLGLTWDAVDFNNYHLQIVQTSKRLNGSGIVIEQSTKTDGSRRVVSITETDVKMLKRLKTKQAKDKLAAGRVYQDLNLVFCKDDGSPHDPTHVFRVFKRTSRNLGYDFRFHDLRHTHASWLLQANEHPKVVSSRLGHSNISTTLDTYSHLMPGMDRSAAEKLEGTLKIQLN